jgi:hypothetical protein
MRSMTSHFSCNLPMPSIPRLLAGSTSPVGSGGMETSVNGRSGRGIAPSVKLLHFVVSRLADLDTASAIEFAHRWRRLQSPIHMRLWAALSRDPRITGPNEAASFLLTLDDRYFWNEINSPEIAELRARRFAEFLPQDQVALGRRLRKLPPRRLWQKKNRNRTCRVCAPILGGSRTTTHRGSRGAPAAAG